MTFSDVLEKVLSIINELDIDLMEEGDKRNRLIEAGIATYQELTNEYINLKAEEEVEFTEGVLYYSLLSKKVKDILSIKQGGANLNFEMYPLFVKCKVEGKAQVKYFYSAETPALDSHLELPPRFTDYLIANGIASEYFYRSGLLDEAAYYRNKFDYSLKNISSRLRGLNLKVDKMIC